MKTLKLGTTSFFSICLSLMLLTIPTIAQRVKENLSGLDHISLASPQLRTVETNRQAQNLEHLLPEQEAASRFIKANGEGWSVWFDLRRGRPSLIDGGAIPFIPGHANSLRWENYVSGCKDSSCIPLEKVEKLARDFLWEWNDLLKVDPEELILDPLGSGPTGDSYYLLRFQWAPSGIPVEGASVYFRINGGNILQIATTKIGDLKLDMAPYLSAETASQILSGYMGGLTDNDKVLEGDRLVIVPVTPRGEDSNLFNGRFGEMIDYRLCYKLVFEREGVIGRWESLVDAHTGELLSFKDSNVYGSVRGTIYGNDDKENILNLPLPFVKTDLPTPYNFADFAGRFEGDQATVKMENGRYLKMVDGCGESSLTTATGEADYGQSLGEDCGVPSPNPSGGGNTWSMKTLYYHMNWANRKAASYLPSNSWLSQGEITVYVNKNPFCNASAGATTINFYRSSSGCMNFGELPGAGLHEWGHSLDVNDGSGGWTSPCETIADWNATLQLRDSCAGKGAGEGGNCYSYGDACTSCDGIRDLDYMKHVSQTPWTAQNHGTLWDCASGKYNGPCGWEDHCESGIASQALWDFVIRDLPAYCGISGKDAWQLAEMLFYRALPTIGMLYSCTVGTPTGTDGCGGDSLYTVMRFLDDSGDGTANGTPHSKAIYKALARHNIACGAEQDVANQNQSTCASLTTPVLSLVSAINDQVYLEWTSAGPNSTYYGIFRNDLGAELGFTKIGTVASPTTSFYDNFASNGVSSNYAVQAVAGGESCAGLMSNVVSVVPSLWAPLGAIMIDSSRYNCDGQVNVTVTDSTPGTPVTVQAWSTTDPSPQTITLAQHPVFLNRYVGSIRTSVTAGSGKVRVGHGDTLTMRYTDPDDGNGNYNVQVFTRAAIDCQGPQISNVRAVNITGTSMNIVWDTDELSTTSIQYFPPPSSASELGFDNFHSVSVSGLQLCTTYYFEMSSADELGNMSTDNNGGEYYAFTTDPQLTPVYVRTPAQAIPDNDLDGVWSASSVYDGRVIQDLNVSVKIAHPRTSDLRLYVENPNGERVALVENFPTSGADFDGTIFDDDTDQTLGGSFGPYPGKYSPLGELSDYDGQQMNGNWKLVVMDTVPGQTGTVVEWKLMPTYASYSCGAELNLQDIYISSENCTGTGGLEDGIIDPGEEVTLKADLYNNGSVETLQVSGYLTSSNQYIAVVDSSSSFDDIIPAGTGGDTDAFRILVSPDAPCGQPLELNLHVSCYENPAGWDIPVAFITGDPDPGGNKVHVLEEDFEGIVTEIPYGWKKTTDSPSWKTSYEPGCGTDYTLNILTSLKQANAWMFTSGIELTPGTSYALTFSCRADDDDSGLGHSLSFYLGSGQDETLMNRLLWRETGLIIEGACATYSVEFTVPEQAEYYLGIYCDSPAGNWNLIVDDISISYQSVASCSMNPCTPCEDPGAPVITSITDPYPCEAGSLRVWFTEGSGASQHDLYMDGTLVMYGIPSSPAIIAPGDDDPHEFFIRAINGECHTDSAPMTGSDEDGPAPGIPTPSALDLDECDPTGIEISWPPVPGATSYDLRVDGTTVTAGVSSPYVYSPGNTSSHAFNLRAKNGNCAGEWSSNVSSADLSLRPAAPAAPVVVDPDLCALTGVQVSWTAVPDATNYDLMIDGSTVINSVSSPHVYQPGNSNNHNYQVRAIRSSCKGNFSAATAGTDRITLETPAPPFVADVDPCAQSGVSVSWSPVPGATGYDLVVDGSELITGVSSPYLHDPKDTAVHAYSVMPKSPSCDGDRSENTELADMNSGVAVPSSFGGGDDDQCNPTGIRLTWSAVSGAAGYDLMVDSGTITDVSSPYVHVPGDTEIHDFRVRAKNSSCVSAWTASLEDKDSADGPPVPDKAPTASDLSACALTGIRVYFDALPGAAYHDIRVDGTTIYPDAGTEKVFEFGDSLTHTFEYRGRTAVCTGLWSPAKSASDLNDTPGAPVITSVEDMNPSFPNGVRVHFTAGGGAERHDLYMDGALVVTFYVSGDPFIPGDALSHDFQMRAIKAGCHSLSNIVQGSDQPPQKPGEIAPGLSPETAQSWIGTTTHTWPADPSCTSGYLLYRGTQADLPYLLDGSEDSCVAFRGYNSGENTKTGLTEDPSAVPGRFFWYLVTGLNTSGEGTAGNGSGGERVIDSSGDCL